MFPDITCDDIFRLETANLWLRWLRGSDSSALAALGDYRDVIGLGGSDTDPAGIGAAERFILQARAMTAAGTALVLAATTKSKARTLIGLVSATARERNEIEIGFATVPAHTGRGHATEAVSTLVETAFQLTETRAVFAQCRDDNSAAHRVLARCGFSEDAAVPRPHWRLFRRGRSAVSRAPSRRLPGMTQQQHPAPDPSWDDKEA